MNLNYSRNEISFPKKPTPKQHEGLTNYVSTQQPIEELIAHITAGKSFTAAHFKDNYRNSDNFIHQQLFAVDIDKNLTLSDAEAILDEYGLSYNFGYYTFRHTQEKPRFRLIFVADGIVTSPDLVKVINEAFKKLFSYKIDQSCSDVARIWHGTTKETFIKDLNYTFSLNNLIEIVNYDIFSKDRNRDRYCFKEVKIFYEFNSTNRGNVIKVYNSISGICPIHYPLSSEAHFDYSEFNDDKALEKWDLEDLLQFEIFRRFYNGEAGGMEDKLSHRELMGIASNLTKVSGGIDLFIKCLKKNVNYNNKESIIYYAKKNKYPSFYIRTFSPYPEDIDNGFQTFYAAVKKHGRVTIIEKQNLISLEEGQRKLVQCLDEVIQAKDKKIYLPKFSAGLGKTEYVKNLKGVVLCFPDHRLKKEHYNTSKLIPDVEKFCIPELKGLFTPEVERYFELLYSRDLGKNVLMHVKSLSKGKGILEGKPNPNPKDVDAAKNYFKTLKKVKDAGTNATIFTTHSRGILGHFDHDTIIFDEGVLQSVLVEHIASIKDLKKLAVELFYYDYDGKELLDILKQEDFDIPKKTPEYVFDAETIYKICVQEGLKTQVYNFFKSESYYIDNGYLHYFVNHAEKFDQDKKYIILDATPNIEANKKLFGDRLVMIDAGEVENTGKTVQNMKYSFTRTQMPKYSDEIFSIINPEYPTITFKDADERLKNVRRDVYHGRAKSTNSLYGVTFNLVGTPHYNPSYYKFLSFSLGLGVTNFEMKYQMVTYKGKQFRFITFEDETLRNIHLENVEAELIQLVQRARLIRTNATVYVYSNFPLPQAIYIY